MGVRYSLRILVVVWAALAGGCSHFQEWRASGKVGPDHCPPTANISGEWQQFNSPYVIAGQNAVSDDNWWQVFDDPEILRFVELANSGHLPLKSAMLRVQEQCLIRNIAVGNLFPQQQEAFGRYNRIQISENGNQFGIPGFGESFDLFEMGFNASWEIDVWGRLRRLVESSTAEVQASVEDVHDVRLCLTADVVSTYTAIRVLQQRIQIARDQVSAQQETLRLAEVRYENGSSTKLDVTQATAIVESTRATIPQLESELRKANNQLCVLLGVPTQVLFDEGNIGTIPATPETVVVGLPRDLLRRRPDIRRAERKVASQSAQIGVAAAELFPKFALRGTINWQAFKFSELWESASNGGAIVPGFSWNLLNYGRLKNRVCVEETRLEQALVAYRQAVISANAEVEDALTAFVKKKEEILAIKQAVEATRESLEIATTQYREGSVDLDRVNNLRKDLIRQLDLETAAEGQAAIALIRVYKTMGGGWLLGGNGDVVSIEAEPTLAIDSEPVEPTLDPVVEHDSETDDSSSPLDESDSNLTPAITPPDTDLQRPVREGLDLPLDSPRDPRLGMRETSNVSFVPIQRQPWAPSFNQTISQRPNFVQPQIGPRTVPQLMPQAVPRIVSRAVPQMVSQSVPRVVPQTVARSSSINSVENSQIPTLTKLSNVPEMRSYPTRTPSNSYVKSLSSSLSLTDPVSQQAPLAVTHSAAPTSAPVRMSVLPFAQQQSDPPNNEPTPNMATVPLSVIPENSVDR